MAAFDGVKKLEISGFFLSLLALFPILRPAMQSIIVLLFTLVSMYLFWTIFKMRIRNKKVLFLFFTFTAYYLWHVLSLLWSEDKIGGLDMLQSSTLLLIFPIVFTFFHPTISQKLVARIELLLILAMIFYGYLWYSHYLEGVSHFQELRLNEVPVNNYTFNEQLVFFVDKGYYWISGSSIRGYRMAELTPKLFLHHSYLSAFLVMAFLCSLRLFGRSSAIITKSLFVITAVYFLVFIVYLPSAVNKLAVLIATPIVIYHFISRKTALLLILVIFGVGAIMGIKNYEKIRTIKLVEKDHVISEDTAFLDYFRYHTYTCVADKLSENAIIGMGAGDVQPYLNDCLPEEDWPGLSENRRLINTHSQFLHYMLSGGVIGIALFLFLWFKLFSMSLSQGQWMAFVVLLIVFLNSIFENFLSRVWGAFFFVYFIFLYLPLNLDPIATINNEGIE